MDKKISNTRVLKVLICPDTLTIEGVAKRENLGVASDTTHLIFLLKELKDSGHLQQLPGVPPSFIQLSKRIDEGKQLQKDNSTLRAV